MYRIFDAKMFSMLSPLLFYQQDLGTSLRWLTWRWSCPQDWQAADEKVKAYDKNHGNKFFHVMRWSQLLRRYALGSIIRSETLPVPFKLMGRRRRAEGMWFHLQVWLLAGMKQKLHFIDVVGRNNLVANATSWVPEWTILVCSPITYFHSLVLVRIFSACQIISSPAYFF